MAEAPIQCLRDQDALRKALIRAEHDPDDPHLAKVLSAAGKFHGQQQPGFFSWGSTRQGFADQRAKALDSMEHGVYSWLRENPKVRTSSDQHKTMMGLLDEIQEAHTVHTDYVHQQNLKLYTPDRDKLTPTEQNRLQQAWEKLRKGTGLIKTPSDRDAPQASREVRAMHARLLSRPGGRKLLYDLLEGDESAGATTVTVHPTPADTSTPEERSRRRRLRKRYNEKLAPLIREQQTRVEGLGGNIPDLNRRLHDESDQAPDISTFRREMRKLDQLETKAGRFTDETRPDYMPMRDPDPAVASANSTGAASLRPDNTPGPGTGSTVRLRTGLKDSEQMNQDAQGNYIPAPAFVVYGHELVHALHYKRGTKRSDGIPRGSKLADYHNQEEYQTIETSGHEGISENLLRREHGLSRRKFHTGKPREEVQEEHAAADEADRQRAAAWAQEVKRRQQIGNQLAKNRPKRRRKKKR
ncbi:MAG TPA: M91 family zinc metallopeptidase [Longimicrobiaceae bacterium]|nr:M91 family zinc metallopeptidase [Longimicrobiaceae bacterium]